MTGFFIAAFAMAAFAFTAVLAPLARAGVGDGASAGTAAGSRWTRWRSALPCALVAPLLAIGLYAALGTPAALLPEQLATEEVAAPQIEAMVARLAARLKAQPRDVEGWRMLARSCETLRRFDQAAEAYRQLLALEGGNADLLADYAVVLGMAQGQRLSGEPRQLLERALVLNPQHMQVLALLGSAAMERGDHAAALRAWKKILALAPTGSPIARSIEQSIQRVESQTP